MNKKVCALAVLICIKLFSCKCNDTYDCPGVSANATHYLNYTSADTIKFINDIGQQLMFSFQERTQSSPYTAKSCKGGPVFCSCGSECGAHGVSSFISDSSRNGARSFRYYINETSDDLDRNSGVSSNLLYQVFDFSRNISLTDTVQLYTGDSLITSLTFGTHTYSDVFVQVIDTLQSAYSNTKIWKTYLTRADGIIGFYDRQTRSLFYRQ